MSKPEIVWVLPNRSHSEDEAVFKDGKRARLSEVVSIGEFPKELVLGIPEGLLQKYGSAEVVFSQYCRQPLTGRNFFALSVPCGTDRDGRLVYLTLLEILPHGTSPHVFPEDTCWPEEYRDVISNIAARYSTSTDKWMARVKALLAAVTSKPNLRTFASVEVPRAAFPTDWTPEKATRKAVLCVAISFSILAMLIILVQVLRSCGR